LSRQRPTSPPITQTTGFWELRAEQVMDRVFGGRPDPGGAGAGSTPATVAVKNEEASRDAVPPIDVLVRDARPEANEATAAKSAVAFAPTATQLVLWGSLFCLPLLLLVGVLLRNLNHSETALNQERNLLLLERLRAINGPGQGSPAGSSPEGSATGDQQQGSTREGLPPPPPSEDWMTELGQLPRSSAPQPEVLRVAPSSQITAAAPPATAGLGGGGTRAGGPVPVLVGVVQAQGRGGAAIFQVDGASTTASPGELIGSSGWRLRSASGDSVLIERGGEQRRLSINTGL
jgi:hypothetical protein